MNETQNQGLGLSVQKSGEMAVAAMAAKAKAMVEAKYVIALNKPRKIMEARAAILAACRQEKFAEGARYRKPVGKKQDPQTGEWKQSFVDGFSIRFAETAIQSMRNISVDKTVIYEDDEKRTVHIDVTDLEANITYGDDITVSKTVERKALKRGQEAIGERTNSNGEKVYIVAATEDEIANKIAAQASKVIRNNGLRLVPQDILADAEEAVYQTLEKGGSDASADVKKVADAFMTLNVNPGELERYLGHPLSTVSKKELSELRAVYAAIRDGESNWTDYVQEKEAFRAAKPIFEAKNDDSNPDLNPAPAKTKKASEKKTEPAQSDSFQTQTSKEYALRVLEAKSVTIEDLRGFLIKEGTFPDCDSYGSFDEVPTHVFDVLVSGPTPLLAQVVKVYGKGGK